MLDAIPSLGALLDGFSVGPAGGRTMAFTYLPSGKWEDTNTWKALAAGRSAFTLRQVSNPTRESNTGGGASQNRQAIDVVVKWQKGADLTDADAFRKALIAKVADVVRDNRRNCPPAYFIHVINAVNQDYQMTDRSGTGSHVYHTIVTVQARGVEVYP